MSQQSAQGLFQEHANSLYQMRIVDLSSGKKSAIGSGFQVSADGLIVTNYHVISDYVFAPERYQIHVVNRDNSTEPLSLVDFDVVNDLALVKKSGNDSDNYLRLANEIPRQGDEMFSLGNPLDLGMIVVPGTFNGLKKQGFYQRINFTGAINPGMSGGPTVNRYGHVVGVNVATGGNQIGFLIPLQPLRTLIENYEVLENNKTIYLERLRAQLLANQSRLMSQLTSTNWKLTRLGSASIPDKVANFFSCWGQSNRGDKKAEFLSVSSRCRLQENVYLHKKFTTGTVEMEFEWLASENLNTTRFYHLMSQRFGSAGPGNKAGENEVSQYRCRDSLVTNSQRVTTKSVLCLRAYKQLPALHDVLYMGASMQEKHSGLISHFTLSGVTRENALMFSQQFMDSMTWE